MLHIVDKYNIKYIIKNHTIKLSCDRLSVKISAISNKCR